MTPTSDRALDDLIDQAARAMTDIEPSADFRARVTGNLGRPTASSPRLVAGVAAVAAALLLALWLPKLGQRMPEVSQPHARVDPPPPLVHQDAAATTLPVTRAIQVAQVHHVSSEEAAWLARSLRPLEASPAITIAPIQPTGPSITPIIVEPSGLQPIELAPLDVRTSGGR